MIPNTSYLLAAEAHVDPRSFGPHHAYGYAVDDARWGRPAKVGLKERDGDLPITSESLLVIAATARAQRQRVCWGIWGGGGGGGG
jgi:hypothetical protein